MGEGGRVWMGCGGCSVLAGSEHGEVTVEREERVKGHPGELGWQGGRRYCCLTIVCLWSLGHEWWRRLLTLACTASTPSHHSSCTHRTQHSDRERYGGREGGNGDHVVLNATQRTNTKWNACPHAA